MTFSKNETLIIGLTYFKLPCSSVIGIPEECALKMYLTDCKKAQLMHFFKGFLMVSVGLNDEIYRQLGWLYEN